MKKGLLFAIIAGVGVLIMAGKSVLEHVIDKMAESIQWWEDYVLPGGYTRSGKFMPEGSRSYRNNNPGNLRWFNPDTIPWKGATGLDEANHVIFDTFGSGLAALKNQLRLALTGRSQVYSLTDTLYDFFGKYAEANSAEYAEYVAGQLGTSPDSTLISLVT